MIKFRGSGLGAAGLNSDINIRYGRMSAASLDDFFTNTLADITGQTSRTITLINQPAISAANTSIATNKGWTIVV
jgi:hypothetical protein